jgi:alpha-tubulin suppressor-like RCC1 family protein
MFSRAVPRSIPSCCRVASTSSKASHIARRLANPDAAVSSYQDRAYRKQQQLLRSLLAIAFAGGVASISQFYINDGKLFKTIHAEAPPSQDEENPIVFEKSRKKEGASKEENRDLISSQHHQVKRSWENPGLYAWGSNTGRVVAPDLPTETIIKTPRRISWFDGKLLRDVKLDRNFGVAIDEKGNLLQWGNGFKPNLSQPEMTLKGKNLVRLAISKDRIIGLSKNGSVYSIPVSSEDQEAGSKPGEASWIPYWTWKSPISYRTLSPKNLGYSEKVTAVDGGLEHAVMLTSNGRIFSCASASDSFPTRGQLGVPGLTWMTRPEGSFDQPHEITTLRGFQIARVACGDYHSLVLDKDGRVFAWGDNAQGQLGFDFNPESTIVDTPSLLPTQKLYTGTSQTPTITSISAGGNNSFMTVDATKVASQGQSEDDPRANRGLGAVTADTFAFGSGIYGQLANSRWTHVQSTPSKIPTLSGLFEYDEKALKTVPIRLAHLSVGTTHAAAVMKNITYLSASQSTSTDDTNWGADIVFWGGNEHYQLGTGKRNNVSTPVYLQPLDMAAEVQRAKRSSGAREEHRFHITPRTTARLGDGRKVSVEQRVECGRNVTCVYSGT